MLINDLAFEIDYIKYVDDTTAISESEDPYDDALQMASCRLMDWCHNSGMKPNPKKCKDMLIYFGGKFSREDVPVLLVGGEPIERVETFKLLGVIFNAKLTWDNHVSYILQKVSKRYYFIYQLARIGINPRDIVIVYIAIIRSVLEYACAVFHSGLTKSQSDDIERVQKRCLKIIFPDLTYSDALKGANIERLSDRRLKIVRSLFDEIKRPGHVLYDLLTPRTTHLHNTRDSYLFKLPAARTQRFLNSFILFCVRNKF